MKTRVLWLGAVALLGVMPVASRAAVTLSLSAAEIVAGQSVTASAQATFTIHPQEMGLSCGLEIDFGDGGPAASASCPRTPCTLSVSHRYDNPGSYTVRAQTGSCRAVSGADLTTEPRTAAARVAVSPRVVEVLAVTVAPSLVRAPREQGLAAAVTYTAAGPPSIATTLVSPSGRFEAEGAVLAAAAAPVSLPVARGAGAAVETVRFTPEILRAAAALGARSLTFTRDFAGGGFSGRTVVTALIIVPAVEFNLERLELAFANNRPEIVVQRNQGGVAARARLVFAGSGLLQAHWEADGRTLAPLVSRHLNLGDTVELESPPLPTFDPGTHLVRLVVTSPPPPWPLPTVVYFVRPSDAAPLSLRLEGPADGEQLPYQPALFRWQGVKGAVVFLVQYYGPAGDAPVFSAWTRGTEYRLPELLYRNLFRAGGKYRWKVSAFNTEENLAGESPMAGFGFE